MATFEYPPTFAKDVMLLDPDDKARFRRVVRDEFVPDLNKRRFRAGLRVKGVHGARGVYEMTWAPDGRATFQYGPEQIPGQPHVIWRRVGTHEVFRAP
jgi:hypothetical protein